MGAGPGAVSARTCGENVFLCKSHKEERLKTALAVICALNLTMVCERTCSWVYLPLYTAWSKN